MKICPLNKTGDAKVHITRQSRLDDVVAALTFTTRPKPIQTMSFLAASAVRRSALPAARNARPLPQQQRRTFLDWMTNYPDKVGGIGCVSCYRQVGCYVFRELSGRPLTAIGGLQQQQRILFINDHGSKDQSEMVDASRTFS
jgi:hypothetical protein